ncbi:putative ribonuclease H-like domain-containing protein [Tanacetum coccineum]
MELLNHDLENVERALGNVLERVSVLESGENATLKKRLAETETKLAWACMERDIAERRLHESRVWNKMFYLDMVRIGAVPKPSSDDEDTELPRKKSKNSTSDGPRDLPSHVDHLVTLRSGPEWLFDIDSLTKSMNYEPVTAGNQTNGDADDKDADEKEGYANSTNRDSTTSPSVSTIQPSINTASENINTGSPNINTASPIPNDSSMQSLENIGIFDDAYDDREVGAEADLNNLETTINVRPIPITRIHKDHPKDQIIRDINSATQTRRMTKITEEHAMVSYIKKQRRTNHKDYQNFLFAYFLSQIEPKKVIQALTDPSWIEAMQEELLQFKLQKVWTLVDLPKGKRAIETKWVYRNKKDKRGIVVRNKARLVEKALYGLHQAPRAWYETLSTYLLENRFRRGTINKTLFIKKDKGDILLIQVYVDDIIFRSTKKSLCVEFEQMMHKRFQMSSMGELTFFLGLQVQQKEDGIFISQDKFQVTPKVSHLHAVKRIFRYLKGQPKLGLWYPRDSPFDLEAFSDSDYAGASLDKKSTTGEYVAGANCYRQVLWIQNQMLDYGFNFMNTKIYIDNESTIYIVKNPKFHSKTKHIEIRYHFIRDSYEKRLIQVIKVHLDHNVADLLTKAFDISRCRDTKIPQSSGPPEKVGDEAVHKELGDRMERAATTASSLEAEQDSGNINMTQSMATLNKPSP